MLKCLKIGALAGISLVLSSCYFNSAGHIFDKAKYNAVLSTNGVKADSGTVVYADGERFYIEVLMGRYDKPVQTMYDAFNQSHNQGKDKVLSRLRTQLVEIPGDFARYLMGVTDEPSTPEYMKPVKNSVKKRCHTHPIKQTPDTAECFFQYKSPGAFAYYTLGVLDWLCVDLPITCVENAIAIPGYTLAAVLNGLGDGLNEGAKRMNTYNANSNVSSGGSQYASSGNVYYSNPVRTSVPAYSAPVVESSGTVPPLTTTPTPTYTSVPSYTPSSSYTPMDSQLHEHLMEIRRENLRERKESFNSMMNLINTDSSIKYVP